MSWVSGLFDKDIKATPLNAPWQQKGLQDLGKAAQPGALERISRAGEPYGGQLVAGMSGAEQQSQDALTSYLAGSPATDDPLFQAAESELTNTLGGETYDPVGGTYYQAYRNAAMRELRSSQDALASRTSASDQFFGGGRIAEEGNLQEGTTNALALELGRLTENERQNRLSAANQAMTMTQYKEQAPLQRISAAQELGALPREIEQAELDAAYQEWNRQLADLGIALDTYTGMLTYTPQMAIQESPSAFEQYGMIVDRLGKNMSNAASAGYL